ncbi:MAG TPA: hypothetical protein VHY58_01020 [Streptosporangiaceae bacterium]|jgi:hypothetical protein|nr:hypothetical protein [Streptosporangiaceae bacterium]
MPTTDPQTGELTSLETLATEIAARGYRAVLRTPAGTVPYLDVTNPRATVLAEQVYARAGRFLYSWGEPIAGCDQPATAAGILARVLRTADTGPGAA